ncbi:MAG: LacI family transcriptional regulator [Treponema sp.]|jgi:LacI family transcriptional regulator|nr:LacI family transcriptional regulator [Treponema sp.]
MPNARIKDVAKHAGVSEATITRVINNMGYVAEETRKKVLKSIDALEYVPNRMARALKNNRTGIIGNVLPLSLDNLFFSYIAASLKEAALHYDYQILPMYNERNKELEERLLQEAVSRMVEGIIFTATVQSSPRAIKEVLNKNIPVIMIERPLDMSGVDKVLLDNFFGSSMAAEKFIAMGHKNLSFIGRELRSDFVEYDRFNGFKQGLERNSLPLKDKMVVYTPEYTSEYGYEAMKKIITQNKKQGPGACFIASDILACGALQYLYDAKLRVPEDISIIGYDNTLSALCSPQITSVAFPYEEIGRTAMSLFWERREQNRCFDKMVQLSPFIIDRGSIFDLKTKLK